MILFKPAERKRPRRPKRCSAFERLEDRLALSLADGLIGYWPFDGNGADLSGNARDLALFGGVGFAPGLFGQALDLHHDNSQYAARTVDDQVFDFGLSNFTIQLWVNFNGTAGEQILIEKFNGAQGPGWWFGKQSGNYFSFDGIATSAQPIVTSLWYHVIVRNIGTQLEIHSNGRKLIPPPSYTHGAFTDASFPLLFGKRNDNPFAQNFALDGRMDEVAIWNRALTDAEIAALYNDGAGSTLPVPTACDSCADAYSVDEDATLSVAATSGVLANDGAQVGETLSASVLGLPGHGTLSLALDGSFQYVPAANYFGVDSFTYEITSNQRGSRIATVTIAVNSQPEPPPPPLTAGLIGYWPFDGTGADRSGNSRDLQLVGGVGFASGLFDQALDLRGNGSQSAIRPVDDADFDFGSRDFTAQVWFNQYSASGTQTFVEKFVGASGPGWTLETQTNRVHFYASPSAVLTSPSSTITTGIWHHLAARKTGAQFDVFLDGVVVVSGTNSTPIPDTTRPLLIGRRDGGQVHAVNARVDEVAIWNRALTSTEIAALYNSGVGTPLVGTPPTACASCADAYSVNEDGTLVVDAATGVLANDEPQVGETLVARMLSSPAHGTLALAAGGSFQYTPTPDFFGVDSFYYSITSNQRDPRTVAVTFTINAQPDLPVAVDDSYQVPTGNSLNINATGVLANDVNLDADTLSARLELSPTYGTLTLSADGAFVYTSAGGFTGTDSFTYRAVNAAGQSNPATVEIIVVRTITPDSIIPLIPQIAGGSSNNYVALPIEGGFYFAGPFFGTFDFDPGPGVTALTSAGFNDAFIALYAPEGLVWVRQIGGADYDRVRSMALDRDGNVYVKGDSDVGPVSFGGTVVATQPASLFFVKLDLNGDFNWIITPTGTRNNRSLAIDDTPEDRSQWSVYTVPLEPATIDVRNVAYITKLSAQNGQIIDTLEVLYIRLSPNDEFVMEDVFVDDRGFVTTVGYDSYVGLGDDTEISRWDSDFNLLWDDYALGEGYQRKQQVVVDAQGNTYVAVNFTGPVDFFPWDGSNHIVSQGSGRSTYVVALDDERNLRWTTVLGGTETVEPAPIAMALDATGNIVIAGRFSGTANFQSFQLQSAGDFDAYVAYLDGTNGDVLGAWRMGGASGTFHSDWARSVGTDATGNIFVEFSVSGPADVPTGEILTTGQYILKFRAPDTTTVANGDVNGDGHVDYLDVAALAANFGATNVGRASGDLNGDGRVSLADLYTVQINLDYGLSRSPDPESAQSPSAVIANARPTHARRGLASVDTALHTVPRLTATRRVLSASSDRAARAERALRASPQRSATIDQVFSETHSWQPRLRNHRGHRGHSVSRVETE